MNVPMPLPYPDMALIVLFGVMLFAYAGYLLLHLCMLELESRYRKLYGREIWIDAGDTRATPRRRRIDMAIGGAIISGVYLLSIAL